MHCLAQSNAVLCIIKTCFILVCKCTVLSLAMGTDSITRFIVKSSQVLQPLFDDCGQWVQCHLTIFWTMFCVLFCSLNCDYDGISESSQIVLRGLGGGPARGAVVLGSPTMSVHPPFARPERKVQKQSHILTVTYTLNAGEGCVHSESRLQFVK